MVSTVRGGNVNALTPKASFEESPKVRATLKDLAERASDGGASSMMFLPQKGVKFEAFAFAYHTSLAKQMNIKEKPKDGVLRGTICINISGHDSGGMAEKIAGYAIAKYEKEGQKVGDDAKKFLAVLKAAQALGYSPSGDVALKPEGFPEMKIPAATMQKLQRASTSSTDDELAELAWQGQEARQKFFAATNTYNVYIRTPDGKETRLSNIPRNNPDKIELATKIPIEIPAMEGETIIQAWPGGSAGVGGYTEAREYHMHIGTGLFDEAKQIEVAEKYQAQHPQVRWGTDHEDEDLEKTHISPSPYPYQDF